MWWGLPWSGSLTGEETVLDLYAGTGAISLLLAQRCRWVYGVELAQASLWFGVDDLDGTVQEEKIYHMAGSATPEGMTTAQLSRLVRAAGREPLERDTLYNIVNIPAVVEASL